ncbi:MAG TPA: sulfatase-like hydrolase/transferase [Blastocatellia bacterium]|nr:sulfatase-like hydrolase/transferase [Blastocatellia bacterium]
MKTNLLLVLSLFLLSITQTGAQTSAEAQRQNGRPAQAKPNILLIVADDLGYADIGVNGCQDVPTPHIDSIAKNGVRFTNGYVSGPYCSPTRAGLMTGRYQQRFGHEFNPGPAANADPEFGLPLTETTMPDRLKSLGYATGMVGKWHLGFESKFHPMKRGFDEYFGFLGGAHSYLANGDNLNQVSRGMQPVKEISYLTDMFGDEAVAFIERQKSRPWFLYLPFNADHSPMHAKESDLARFAHIKDPLRQKFAAMHAAMDTQIGRVLETLRKHKLEENTLILFVSDNGGPTNNNGSRNAPLRGFKAQTWEGGIRVPMLAQWKRALPAGKVYDQPVIQLDFLPTALAAAGAEAKAEWKLDGVNLLPHLTGKEKGAPHAALYWRFGQQIAVRMGDWKLVKAPGANAAQGEFRAKASTEGAHLYNLARDVGEQNNLAEKEPGKLEQLASAWDKWNAELQEPRWVPERAARNRRR